jgi:hypothetical protein
LNVFMLSVIMLSVIMLSVIMLSVVASQGEQRLGRIHKTFLNMILRMFLKQSDTNFVKMYLKFYEKSFQDDSSSLECLVNSK